MKINKSIKGIAVGTSLAAFVTLGVPATSHASDLLHNGKLGTAHSKRVDEKAEKKKDDKNKKKGEGEKSCGEGKCGEGKCGKDKKGEEKK